MKTKITILIITIIIRLTSCNKNENELNIVEFTQIGQNNLYGDGAENIAKQNLVISESNSWSELIDKMNTVNSMSDGFTETDIDFVNFMVIAVFDKIYRNRGHSINITEITENENNIIVKVDNILKGDATLIMTQPFHIIKIQKTDKIIIFE